VQGDGVKEMLHAALALGINAFDTSENYSNGKSEEEMHVC
jgi:aryl-alcohol dehydrogenase-like predicted oxidoreductase